MYKKMLQFVGAASFLLFVLVLSPTALAGSNSPPPVAPLGFEIGHATRAAVLAGLRGKTNVKPDGTNLYSNGPMLVADGEGLGIEGLQQVRFIFDKSDRLVAMQFRVDKDFESGFDRVYKRLAAKYPLVSQSIPFVGDKMARFESGNAVILLIAPHMSFVMTVTYMTRDFEKTFQAMRHANAVKKAKREESEF